MDTCLNFTIFLILISEKWPNPILSNDTLDMAVPVMFLEYKLSVHVGEPLFAAYQVQQILVKTNEKSAIMLCHAHTH